MEKSAEVEAISGQISLILSIVFLFAGGMVYVLFRPTSLLLFYWLDAIGLLEYVNEIRSSITILLPQWVEYSLPDGLWVFSYSLCVGFIWSFDVKRCLPFLLLLPLVSVVDECLQLFRLVPGTFDLCDLYAYLLASILGISYVQLVNKIIKYYEKKS